MQRLRIALPILIAAGCAAPVDSADLDSVESPPTATWTDPNFDIEADDDGVFDPAAAGADLDAPFHFGFAFVVHAGEPLLVLEAHAPEALSAAGGERVSLPDAWLDVRRKRIDERLLDDERRAWIGQKVVLHTEEGGTCHATVAEPWLVDRRERVDVDPEEPSPTPFAETDAPVQTMIAAALVADSDCGTPRYATPALFGSVVFSPVEPSEVGVSVTSDAMAALRGLPEYQAIQLDYEHGDWRGDDAPKTANFEQHDGFGARVTLYREPGGRTLAVASVWAGLGCGDFDANLTAAFETTERGLVLRTVQLDAAEAPLLLVEHGGRLALLGEERASIPTAGHDLDMTPPIFSCPC